MSEYVSVCVRESVCVRVRARLCARERVCVCACVRVCERERESVCAHAAELLQYNKAKHLTLQFFFDCLSTIVKTRLVL